jgi:NADH-quinone oxidoreductase subunit F
VKEILERLEAGGGEEADIGILREHIKYLNYSFCALAPGAMAPLDGLLAHFEDEVREHIKQKSCPFK